MRRGGTRLSTLDLFGGNFVLLTGARGATWRDLARDAARPLGVGLDAYQVADGEAGEQAAGELADADSGFCAAYGISPDGAVLVRPDGFVAWRAADATSATNATAEGMTGILSRVLCRANP